MLISFGVDMPEGIFLMRWDPRRGPEILGMYPSEIAITQDELIDIFGTLLLREEERREGFYTFRTMGATKLDVVAYYSGQELNQIFGIILSPGEKPDDYRGGLVRIALKTFKLGEIVIDTEERWLEIWGWLLNYPSMTIEQRLGEVFQDEETYKLLEILVESGITTIDDIVLRMKTEFPVLSRDVIITYVHTLEALDVFATKWDEKALIERVFLLRDVLFHRKKPEKFDEIAKKISTYEDKWKSFAKRYYEGDWMNDRAIIPRILGDPERYRVLSEFRRRGVLSESDIATMGWSEYVEELKNLEILDKEDDKYYLFSDPTVAYVFPKYTIAKVVEKLRDGELDKNLVIEYLRMLREAYSRT